MKILHLYYDLMNLYGEYGNVVVLKKHLEDQGFEVLIDKKTIDEEIVFEDYDFVYCGSGTEKNELLVLVDLIKRKDAFLKGLEKGMVVLFTGNAMELLGESIDDKKALALAPFKTVLTKNRYTGDVIVKNEKLGEIVGFINKCSFIDGGADVKLFSYLFKDLNLKDNDYEGYKLNDILGTHIIGPILVKNPAFMKYIVTKLGLKESPSFIYKEKSYPYEEDSYNVTLRALKERIK